MLKFTALLSLSLLSSSLLAATAAQIQTMKHRLSVTPSNCGLITSPLSSSDKTSINNSSSLREAVFAELLEKVDPSCLRLILQNLAFEPNNKDQIQQHRDRLNAHLQTVKPVSRKAPEVICYDPPTGLEELLALAKETKKINECRPMNPGDWVVVDERTGPTGIGADYALTKLGPQKWVAALSLDVRSRHGVSSAEMFGRINQCINAVNPAMRGPNNEQLEIKILTPDEASKLPRAKRPPTVQIEIQPTGARSHSKAYAADINCSTIVHEVLHLLGLCDEYKGDDDGYQCRAVPSGDSIMKSHWTVFNDTIPRQLSCECVSDYCHKLVALGDTDAVRIRANAWSLGPVDYEFRNKYCGSVYTQNQIPYNRGLVNKAQETTPEKFTVTLYDMSTSDLKKIFPMELKCECPAGDAKCKAVKDEVIRDIGSYGAESCPAGSKEKQSIYGVRGKVSLTTTGFTVPGSKPRRSTLLEPVHFSRIIGGSCEQVVTQYNECAKWAYKGTSNQNDCSGRPVYCDTDDWMK